MLARDAKASPAHGARVYLLPPCRAPVRATGGRTIALVPADAVAARWFAGHDVTWALQRPDFHLYGTGHRPGRRRLLTHPRDRLVTTAPTSEGTPP